MKIIRDIKTWKQCRASLAANKTIGFIPTMGGLHTGHLSLIVKSVNENDTTILSLFTNPTQFNEASDYENYPKTEEEDINLAQQLEVDYVFIPEKNQMYPDDYQFKIITTHPLSKIMEGEFRPGHFNGMLTIVLKLLLLIKPTSAYFGEKDYQQLKLVNELTKAFFLDTKIVACPTVREHSKLPFSSRHQLLSNNEKLLADCISNFIHSSPYEKDIERYLTKMGVEIEYVKKYNERLFIAFKIGNVRLIDNFLIEDKISC